MEFCEKCKKSIETHGRIRHVVCSGACTKKFHGSCVNLDESLIPLIISSVNIRWLCDGCLIHSRTQTDLWEFRDAMSTAKIWKQFESHENLLSEIQNRLNRLENYKFLRKRFHVNGKPNKIYRRFSQSCVVQICSIFILDIIRFYF